MTFTLICPMMHTRSASECYKDTELGTGYYSSAGGRGGLGNQMGSRGILDRPFPPPPHPYVHMAKEKYHKYLGLN